MADTNQTEMIDAVLKTGTEYVNLAASPEGPGHLPCMLYSAMVCPYLAGPDARRGSQVTFRGETLHKGESRGAAAAVVAHDSYSYEVSRDRYGFVYGQPLDIFTYERGEDLLDVLAEAIRTEPAPQGESPPWLLDDDRLARAEATKAIQEYATTSPPARTASDRSRKRGKPRTRRRNR